MAGRATITFTQPGIQPPVYVVTSLSTPPWETLELRVADKKTGSGDFIFTREFDDVVEGSYQYKIRIGEGYWVIDESKNTATDDSGNRNNVINVKADVDFPSRYSSAELSTSGRRDSLQHDEAALISGPNGDKATPDDVSLAPAPFVVVEKVVDKNQPEYGDVLPESLREDATKRTADAEPDYETVHPETPTDTKQQEIDSQIVPIIVVEKTDDSPSHGEDFGEDATSAQKVAHELRAADATPDQIIVSLESEPRLADSPVDGGSVHIATPDTEESDVELQERTIPLSHYEVLRPESIENNAVNLVFAVDAVDEESARSSTDRESSYAGLDTPSEVSENRDVDEDEDPIGELDKGPLLPHESGLSDDEPLGELDNGPLLSHETGFSGDDADQDNDILIEGDSGLFNYGEEIEYEDELDPQRAPTFPHETDDGYYSEALLLPHEQNSNEPSRNGVQTFDYETATDTTTFSPHFFMHRTRNSALPDRLPRSDEEDKDLNDPLLEEFPTDREQILERVATIGSHLAVDETRENRSPHSPELSVLSQACSSTDLAPTTSHTLLNPVEEATIESDSECDSESSSGGVALVMGNQSKKAPDTREIGNEESSRFPESTKASEADSVQKNDGANDSTKNWGNVYNLIATPAKILNPSTPPPLALEKRAEPAAADDLKMSHSIPRGCQNADVSTPPTSRDTAPQKKNWLGEFARFLAAYFGQQKQVSGAIVVVGLALAAYYYIYGATG